MILDIVFALCCVFGFYTGFRKGILYSVVSIFSVIIASIAAMKLSLWFSLKLQGWLNIPPSILPFVSMILIFILVVASLKLIAYLLERFLESIQLTKLNQFAGALLWIMLALFIWSVFIWLMDQACVIKPEVKTASFSYAYIQPIAPLGFKLISFLMPIFKEWIAELEKLFGMVGKN